MNKIALTLIALGLASTAAFAARNNDLRDSDAYIGQYSNIPQVEYKTRTVLKKLPPIQTNSLVPSDRYQDQDREMRRINEKNGSH